MQNQGKWEDDAVMCERVMCDRVVNKRASITEEQMRFMVEQSKNHHWALSRESLASPG